MKSGNATVDLSRIYPKREAHMHKGEHGRLVVIAGSRQHTGSAIFNAMAALRSGCDLVTVISPQRSADVASQYAPDIMSYPLAGEYITIQHVDEIMDVIKEFRAKAIVLGGGLGRKKSIYDTIEALLYSLDLPMVIDAEAIRCIGQKGIDFKGKEQTIITPNANEYEELTNRFGFIDKQDKESLIKKIALRHQSVILLKGHVDLIANGKEVAKNTTGSPFMTKGGFGDTLAGICGALLARGTQAFSAAQAAAYLNGKAGELAAQEKEESVIASDIFGRLPQAIHSV